MSKKIGKRYFRKLVSDASNAIMNVENQVIIATDADYEVFGPLEEARKYIESLEQKIFKPRQITESDRKMIAEVNAEIEHARELRERLEKEYE